MKTNRSKGGILIAIGILLIISAACIVAVNLKAGSDADKAVGKLLDGCKKQIAYENGGLTDFDPSMAAKSQEDSIAAGLDGIAPRKKNKTPTVSIYGVDVIGYVTVPKIGAELSVTDGWNYQLMKRSACRYYGEPQDGDLIICAHNYPQFFGSLANVASGDIIQFVAMDGVRYTYEVTQTQLIGGYDAEGMVSGSEDWDLTLFTCTWSGRSRVTVRAVMVGGAAAQESVE